MDKQLLELMVSLQEQIDGLWRYLGHTDDARSAREKATEWERRTEDLRRELSTFLIQTNSQTESYFRVVSAVAYAGYFATWSLVNKDLPVNSRFTKALLGIISFGTFSLWQIFISHIKLKNLGKMGELLRNTISPEYFEEERQKIANQEAKFITLTTPIWKFVMFVCVGCLMAGSSIMIYYFLNSIF